MRKAVKIEDKNPFAWQLLAIAYGRQENIGMSALSLAEKALAEDNLKSAKEQVDRALKLLKDTPSRQRANDILNYIQHFEKEKK